MTSDMHLLGAAVVGYGAVKIGIDLNPFYLVGGSLIGGLLPDIDHPESKLGRKIRPISNMIFVSVGHRTFTHSLLFVVIIGLLTFPLNKAFGTGIMLGMLIHILLDLLTPNSNGVAFLYPFIKKRIRLAINVHSGKRK